MLSTVTKQNSINKIGIQEVIPNNECKKRSKAKVDCKKNPLKCDICGLIISNKWNLTLHMRIHNNDRRYKCDKCSASFIIAHDLKKHSLAHAGIKPAFKCRFCPKTYSSRSPRYLHEDTHDKKLQYKCRHCPEIFSKFLLRKTHERESHVKDGIFFNCSHCKRKFTSRSFLETHEKNFHKKEEGGFRCNECGQFFETSIILNMHRRIHTFKTVMGKEDASGNEKKGIVVKKNPTEIGDTFIHKCIVCLECYTSRADMITHMLNTHPVETKAIFKFSCNQCDKIFKTKHELIQHLVTHIDKHNYFCSLCDYKAKQNTDLKVHMLKHSDALLKKNHDIYKCIICLECFTFRTDVMTHMLNTHPEETKAIFKFSCNQCDKIFKTKQELTRHLITHNGEKKYCCSLCDHKSKRINDLRVHMRKHTEDKKNPSEICDIRTGKCNICSEHYSSREDMMTHMSNTHSEVTKIIFKFTCNQCNKIFKKKQGLRNHLIIHNSERKYSCSHCDYKAKRYNMLKVHMQRKHTEGKKKVSLLKMKKSSEICNMRLKKCNICSKCYPSRADVMTHMSNTHPEETKATFKFSCNQCDKIFKQKQVLTYHLLSHNDEKKYCCSLCDFKAKQNSRLKAHLKRHAEDKYYVCEICDLKFYQKKLFQEHRKKSHFGKVFKCKLCGMSFARRRPFEWHKIKHEKGGFQCNKCGKFMGDPYTLKRHVKSCKCDEIVKFTEPVKINIENCPSGVRTIEKCYECFVCGFSSCSELTMSQHETSHNCPLSVQTSEKCYECFACGFSTCSELTMSQHETSHNIADVCDKINACIDTGATCKPKKNSETNLVHKILKNSSDKSDYNGDVLLSSCDKLDPNGIILLRSQSNSAVNPASAPLENFLNIFYDHF